MIAQAIAHFIVAFILNVDNLAVGWVGFQGLILTILLVSNLAINFWDTKLRFKELLMKSEQILSLVEKCSRDKQLLRQWRRHSWNLANTKMLFTPKSPCLHQTLAYRDESCLNLPDYLLVKDDIIHLYPGEKAPGDCIRLSMLCEGGEVSSASEKNVPQRLILQEGQIYHGKDIEVPKMNNELDNSLNVDDDVRPKPDKKNMMMEFSHAKLKKATKGADFMMLSTPYIKSLRISLQRSHKRPVNSVEKECFIVSRKYFETFVIPSVFLLSTVVTAIHYGYLDLTDSDQKIKTISIAYLLLRPSLTIMPFLPWMFPCFWLAVNAYGSARILCCGEAQREKSKKQQAQTIDSSGDDFNYSPNWPSKGGDHSLTTNLKMSENLLATPTAAGSSENKHDEDDLHDLRSNIRFTTIFRVFLDLIMGKSGHVWRSSSLLQVLGCLTSLCCIDKVGVLSWSNPTPEKVFILTKNNTQEWSQVSQNQRDHLDETQSHNQDATERVNQQRLLPTSNDDGQLTSNDRMKTSITVLQDDQISSNNNSAQIKQVSSVKHSAHPEILDVSQASQCFRGTSYETAMLQLQGRLQFDDPNWGKYINNLKSLGLTILMNNCCEKSFGDYFRFYKHISYESILRCNLTPVVKRRCLCGLARLIGFSKEAVENYKYIKQLGIYKLIDPRSVNKGKLVSSLENTTRLKLPFPNMICNIHQDVTTGGYQVFSSGTADVIVDACVGTGMASNLFQLMNLLGKKYSTSIIALVLHHTVLRLHIHHL